MPIQLSGSLVITGSITTTGGITISGSILSASYSDTASFSNNFRVLGNLTASTALVTGTLTAQTLVVQTVTSSIVYSSGSNLFGSQLSDRQTFTGSLQTTGSNTFSGFSIFSTGINEVARFKGNYPNGVYVTFESGSTTIADIGSSSEVFTAASTLDFGINSRGNRKLQLGVNQTVILTVSGSNIGIGVTTPTRTLHVHSGATSYSTPSGLSSTSAILGTNLTSYAELQLVGNNSYGAGILLGDITNGSSGSIYQFGGASGEGGRMRFIAGGVETMNLRNGNIGIGINTPVGKLHVYKNGLSAVIGKMSDANVLIDSGDYGNSTYTAQIAFGYYSGTFTYAPAAIGFTPTTGAASGYGDLTFNTRALTTDTAPLERMRITSDGKTKFTFASDRGIRMSGTLSTESNLASYQSFTENIRELRIVGSTIYFNTGDGSNSTGTERMNITEAGVVQLGSSQRRNALQQSTFGYGGSYRTLLIGSTGTDYQTNAVTLAFNVDLSGNSSGAFGGDGTEYFWRNVGSFKTPNSSNNGYNTLLSWNSSGVVTVTTSDYRAKEDLKSFEALPMVEAMKLYDFRWIELQNRMHGVLAHELQDIVPYAVMGEKDSESMQGVDYSKLVPVMLKAIQELSAKVTALETK